MVSSRVARLSFPPENDTITGTSYFSMVFLMNPVASAILFSRTALLASTASSQVRAFAPAASRSSCLYHLVLTAIPLSAATISGPVMRAIPVAMTSLSAVTIMISSPGLMSGSASTTPGAIRFLLSLTNGTALGSHTTYPLVYPSPILYAPCMRDTNFHPEPMSYLMVAMTLPSMITSSMRSRPGALLRMTMWPSGRTDLPVPFP